MQPIVDSGFYAACAGLRARTQALEIVANDLSNLNTVGYSSSQVDKRKVGKLATDIQVAFQELGVFPASSKIVASDSSEPIPFSTVQAIENAERTAAWVASRRPRGERWALLRMATSPVFARSWRMRWRRRFSAAKLR
jgi:hypothetical protein